MMYDDYFFEPSEFDQEIEAFKETLRASVKKEVQQELDDLREEVAELRLLKRNFDDSVRQYKVECERREREAQRAIDDAKRMRVNELLSAVAPFAWAIETKGHKPPKCDKCDALRRRYYTTPLGRKTYESCTCDHIIYTYYVKKAPIIELCYGNREISQVTYLIKEGGEYERYRTTETVFCDEKPFEKINSYHAMFRSETKARLYAAWLNRKEAEKNG